MVEHASFCTCKFCEESRGKVVPERDIWGRTKQSDVSNGLDPTTWKGMATLGINTRSRQVPVEPTTSEGKLDTAMRTIWNVVRVNLEPVGGHIDTPFVPPYEIKDSILYENKNACGLYVGEKHSIQFTLDLERRIIYETVAHELIHARGYQHGFVYCGLCFETKQNRADGLACWIAKQAGFDPSADAC